jgi:hypothetical protein
VGTRTQGRGVMTKDIPDMLEALGVDRGCVVSSADCCEIEIADARLHGRFFVEDDGCGYVMRPREWLMQAVHAAEVRGILHDVFQKWHQYAHEGDGIDERDMPLYERAKAILGGGGGQIHLN